MDSKRAEREKEIGRRLRTFREGLRIDRAKFAVAVGVGSERIASHESGRSPLRYEVFQAITAKFYLDPAWLATGHGFSHGTFPFDDSDFQSAINSKLPFSTIYDTVLSGTLASASYEWRHETKMSGGYLDQLMTFAESRNPEKDTVDPTVLPIVEGLAGKLTAQAERMSKIARRYREAATRSQPKKPVRKASKPAAS